MTNHIADDLPLLLTGEATRAEVLAAAAHLRECDDCRTELVSAVVAHASLSSAQRFAPEILATVPAAERSGAAPLPDLSSMFEQVRAETVAESAPAVGRSRTILVAAAVAAGLAVGGGATYLASHTSSSTSGRQVALAAYDDGTVAASARLSDGNHMTINAAKLPKLDARHRYEVWLTNSARTAMQPVGWIDEDGKASIDVPDSLMSSYSAIEVSVQKLDAPYTYSGTSVLRGSY